MKEIVGLIIIFFTVILFSSCSAYYPDMTGTVVDAETGKPIEGAVILVEWTKRVGIGDYHTESVKVVEVLTDKDGKFKLPGIFNPFVDPPDMTVYRKGYVAWSSRSIFSAYEKRTDFHWQSLLKIRLEKFKEGYSYIDHTSFIRSSVNSSINLEAKKAIYEAFRWEDIMSSKEMNQKARKQ